MFLLQGGRALHQHTARLERFLPGLKRQCLRIAGSSWDADDLMQETLLKVHAALQADPNRPISKAYLDRIARTTWIDRCRKQRIVAVDFGDGMAFRFYDPDGHLLMVRNASVIA